MDPLTAILICAVIYAVGDYVSSKSGALLPMLFVSGFLLLLGFWTFLPSSLLEDTGLFQISVILAPLFVVHTGSMMNVGQMRSEYKTVLIALAGVVTIAALLFFVGSALIGKQQAVAAAGPISGGLVAVLIVQEAAGAAGLESIAIFVTILFVLQLFVGLPIASVCLRQDADREIKAYRERGAESPNEAAASSTEQKPAWRIFPATPDHLKTPFVLLTKALLVAWLAVSCAALMDGVINKFIMALAFGVLFKELGFLEEKVLDGANTAGFLLFVLFTLVYWYLPKTTPSDVVALAGPVMITFVVALAAIAIVSAISSVVSGYSWRLCMALGVSCMFGFPGTLIVPEEVAKAKGNTPQEKAYLTGLYLPKMLIAGLTTVSVASIVISGVMVQYL
ncbi:MAG: hypothetical protein AB8B96_15760 [Lysobacterales bacterium]